MFVLNMIALHAIMLVLLGRFSTKLYLAYSLYYIVGTTLAVQVPVVGWTPLKSLEQLGACAVFLGFQVLQVCEMNIRKKNMSKVAAWKLRVQVVTLAAVLGGLIIFVITPAG